MRPSDFLASFFQYAEGSIYCCSLPNERDGSRPLEICGRGDGSHIDERVLQTWDKPGRGTFFCVNTVTPRQACRSKETIHEVTCLHADLDLAKIDAEPDMVLHRLQELEFPPSKIVHSGHGYHVYWIFAEALLATPELTAQVETALRGLANMLAGDPSVCEVARLMRVPGSHNTKDGGRIPVTVLVSTNRRYEFDDLREWITETARPLIPRKLAAKPANGSPPPDAGDRAPIDVEQRLRAMKYRGEGDNSIHQTQVSVSASLFSQGVGVDEIVERLMAATRAAVEPEIGARWDWAEEERGLRGMIASWARKKANGGSSADPGSNTGQSSNANPQPPPAAGAPIGDAPGFSEEKLALEFATRRTGDARFVATWGKWLRYDGTCWSADETMCTFDIVRAICRAAASQANHPSIQRTLASAKTVGGVERLARSDRRLATSAEQWDANAWTINTGG
jgi:hypothetical protein